MEMERGATDPPLWMSHTLLSHTEIAAINTPPPTKWKLHFLKINLIPFLSEWLG
jgi:hypothetical protein